MQMHSIKGKRSLKKFAIGKNPWKSGKKGHHFRVIK